MHFRRQITVDIFVDELTPEVPTESVREGLEFLNQTSPWFRVRDGVQSFDVLEGGDEYIRADKTSVANITADIGILVTGRYLALEEHFRGRYFTGPKDDDGLVTVGYAHIPKKRNIARFAIVGAGERYGSSANETARHEVAHLLGVKQEGRTFDGTDHCKGPDCTMAAVDEVIEEFVEVEVAAKHALSKRPVIRKEKQLVSRKPEQGQFCDECADQFFTNADIFRQMLAGRQVSGRDKQRILAH